jgi:hypothetical protein
VRYSSYLRIPRNSTCGYVWPLGAQAHEGRGGVGGESERQTLAAQSSDSEDDFDMLLVTHNRVKEQRGQLASLLQQEQDRRIELEHQNRLLLQRTGRPKLGDLERAAERTDREVLDVSTRVADAGADVTGDSHTRPDPLSQTI